MSLRLITLVKITLSQVTTTDPWNEDTTTVPTEPDTDNFSRYDRKNKERAAAKTRELNKTKPKQGC